MFQKEFFDRYNVETLRMMNESYDYEHRVTEDDVTDVNKWVRFIESSRSVVIPKAGDRINFTCRHGDYSSVAIIDKDRGDNKMTICIRPDVPFIYETTDNYYLDTSGGPFSGVPKYKLKYAGKTKNMFKVWGHCGACANGAVYFSAEVSLWEYSEPDPYYGNFTTKDWRKIYFHKSCEQNSTRCQYSGNGMTFKTEKEFQDFLKEYRGTVFDGNYPNQMVVWCYNNYLIELTKEEWDKLDIPVTQKKVCGMNELIKVKVDDIHHLTTTHFVKY